MVTLIKSGVKAVGASASSVTVTFATDTQNETTPVAFPAGYTVVYKLGAPSWATSVRETAAASRTAFSLAFGTATGTGGGTIPWEATGYKLA